jgi:hypothetical protein
MQKIETLAQVRKKICEARGQIRRVPKKVVVNAGAIQSDRQMKTPKSMVWVLESMCSPSESFQRPVKKAATRFVLTYAT